jgi:predicted TIM-barrel fold metal-dependent hydrolase
LRIVDAQVHIWKEEDAAHPWPPGGRERAHRALPWTADEVLRLMDKNGVERSVLVPPSFSDSDNEQCLQAAHDHPDRFAVMGRIAPQRPENIESFLRWREQPGMLGVRMTLSRGEAQKWIANGTLDWFWDAAEQAGIPVYVLPPGLLPEIRQVAIDHPGLRLIIDHLGIRTGTAEDGLMEGLEEVLPLADQPNIAVKATALPAFVPTESFPYPLLQPIVKRVVREFGAHRVFWGSDASRLTSYEDNLALFTEQLDFLTPDDLDWIMGRGLSEWLGWPL